MTSSRVRKRYNLPERPFLYTLDQIADLLNIPFNRVTEWMHFDGISPGVRPDDRMIARNIATGDMHDPEWRVEEREFVRWMRYTRIIPMARDPYISME